MTRRLNTLASVILESTEPDARTIWGSLKRCIISLGDYMTMKKTAGKLLKGDIHAGRSVGKDSAKSSAPANLVLPKATKAPKAPEAAVSVLLRVEPANKKE